MDGGLSQDSIKIYGGTLAGSGMIVSPTTIVVDPDASVTPGDLGAPSVLTIGTMTMDGNVDFAGILGIDLASSSSFDSLNVINGGLNFTSDYDIAFALIFPLTDPFYTFAFLHVDFVISGFNPSVFTIGGVNYAGYAAALAQEALTTRSVTCD